MDYLDEAIDRVSAVIARYLAAEQEAIALLDTIPGVSQRTAEILLAEIGTAMTRFPSAKHLASWAGMCPGNYDSGGKRLSGKTRQGSRGLRQVLVEAAHVAATTQQTYLAAQYQRIAARRGKKRALIALGHTILVIVHTLVTRKQPYQDLGAAYFDSLEQQRVERRLVRRLERLGYRVSLQPNVAWRYTGTIIFSRVVMPRGAPRAMKMVMCAPTLDARARMCASGLAVRSFRCWCREPAAELEPGYPQVPRSVASFPAEAEHAR
jgi:hypothetical protein